MECSDRRDAVICGIDPGLRVMGYAVILATEPGPALVDAGVCRMDESLPLARRLVDIHRDLVSILVEHKPEIVAVESLYAHYKHPRTAILMGHARGVILLEAGRRNIEVRSFAATQVKRYLTGNGRASKIQIQRAIKATLGLPSIPEPPDLADALAISLCCCDSLQRSRIPEAVS